MKPQPAIKSYFFGKGYKDLSNTIVSSWNYNWQQSKSYFQKTPGEDWPMKIIYSMGGISVVIFGTTFFIMISLLHVGILILCFTAISISFTVVFLADYGYRTIKKVFMACPYCYTKSILPVYHCPNCNDKHDRLWPGTYGILKRTCKCGEKFPTTFFNGRNKLTATCPVCNQFIESLEARPVAIPVIGAPSVGKTFFVFSMVWYMKEQFARKKGYTFEFMNTANEALYNAEISSLNTGLTLRKTTESSPVALNFFLTMNSSKSIFYLYDPAGEAFASTESLVRHKFYDYFHGLLFIIDPFSIPDFYYQYETQLMANPYIKPSSTPLEEVFDALIINLEKNYGVKITEKISRPVAIAFSKVDVFDLQDIIGDKAISQLMATDFTIKTENEARKKVYNTFLDNYGMSALARKIEWKFTKFQYFAICSNGQNSTGIDKMMDWFLGEIDKSFK